MAPMKKLKSSEKGKTVDKKSKDSKGSSTSETGRQNQKGKTIDKDNKASKGNKCSEIIKKTISSEQDSGSKSSKNIDKGTMNSDRDMKHQYLVEFGILPGSDLYEDCMVTGLAGWD